MQCTNCGHDLTLGAPFCGNCGAQIVAPPAPVPPVTLQPLRPAIPVPQQQTAQPLPAPAPAPQPAGPHQQAQRPLAYAKPVDSQHSNATTIVGFILAIIGLFLAPSVLFGIILGIIGIIMCSVGKSHHGGPLAKAGIIIGIITLVLSVLIFVFYIILAANLPPEESGAYSNFVHLVV